MCVFRVNLKEILSNFNKAKSKLKVGTKICVVVKANAYGFGLKKICTLLSKKADYFAVARLGELIKIKELGIKTPVLILSPLSKAEMLAAIECEGEISINNLDNLIVANELAKKKNKRAKVHIQVDTGMNRFGVKSFDEYTNLLKKSVKLKYIDIVGVYSHLYEAENPDKTSLQREKFEEIVKLTKKFGLDPIFHLANSEGLKDQKNQYDMVRIGYDLYYSKSNLHSFEATIAEIKTVTQGESVSYNGTFNAICDTKIAICSAGYADGVPRVMSNKGEALIAGERCKIVGTVCMDVFMADITGLKNVKVGDKVVIFGCNGKNAISVCEMAETCGTIGYEIYTGISERVKRVYKWR